ncbi:hypothetical protein FJZ53_06015 [Candidatus Woesearchaeota archaeon]|nr:hypothetical protein [Candidatus Woesearchaeota archaeon]
MPGNPKKANLFANYFLMLSIVLALFSYFTRAAMNSVQNVAFLMFFAVFFMIAGYISVRHKVVFSPVSVPVEKQPRRNINIGMGLLFMVIGFLLLYAGLRIYP